MYINIDIYTKKALSTFKLINPNLLDNGHVSLMSAWVPLYSDAVQ